MIHVSLYPITGVMLGAEIQVFEECNVFVLDLLILRVMIEWDQ